MASIAFTGDGKSATLFVRMPTKELPYEWLIGGPVLMTCKARLHEQEPADWEGTVSQLTFEIKSIEPAEAHA